jgi:stearoyl-CoA desaturase (delta-9 desaturase)
MELFVRNFIRFRTFFLWPLAIVYLLWQMFLIQDPTWILLGLFLYYIFHQLGLGIGYHKLFAHRAFTPVAWYPPVAVVVGSMCFQGDPIVSSIVHRQHHQHADTDQDPHSPIKNRWHAFWGWMWKYELPPPSAKIASDLGRDFPFLIKYSKIEWLVQPVCFAILALISHWLMLACLLAAVLSFASGLSVNAFSHDPKITDKNKAVNQKLVAQILNPIFLHRNHHDHSSLNDYSTPEVRDFSGLFIKYFLIKRN